MPDPPASEIEALYQAGLRLEANGALELAARIYRQALKSLEPDDQGNFIVLHYRLGRVAEALGRREEAEEHYNQVAATDQSY
jgi:tetratricopeptide (TPR) repeat protein